jgi:hypothetical protein
MESFWKKHFRQRSTLTLAFLRGYRQTFKEQKRPFLSIKCGPAACEGWDQAKLLRIATLLNFTNSTVMYSEFLIGRSTELKAGEVVFREVVNQPGMNATLVCSMHAVATQHKLFELDSKQSYR